MSLGLVLIGENVIGSSKVRWLYLNQSSVARSEWAISQPINCGQKLWDGIVPAGAKGVPCNMSDRMGSQRWKCFDSKEWGMSN